MIHTRVPGLSRKRAGLPALSALFACVLLLAVLIRANPDSGTEITVMEWFRGWSWWGADGYLAAVSKLTDFWPRLALLVGAVLAVCASGRFRRAFTVGLAFLVVGVIAYLIDYTLGEIAGRVRPIAEPSNNSFPSGHTFGSTWTLGFVIFLAVRHAVPLSVRVPVILTLGTLIVSVGASRIFLGVHWPADVAGGYALGAVALIAVIFTYRTCEKVVIRSTRARGPGGNNQESPGPLPDRSIQ